jgi:hypothetical protein
MRPDVTRIRRWVFSRHAHPVSAWSRWTSTPLILVPIWTRRWSTFAPIGAWMITNPIVTPPPADDSAWATRAVLGEELWLTDHPNDRLTAINAVNSAALIATILMARKHNKPLTIMGTAISMALTLVSWNLYADYYDQHHDSIHR